MHGVILADTWVGHHYYGIGVICSFISHNKWPLCHSGRGGGRVRRDIHSFGLLGDHESFAHIFSVSSYLGTFLAYLQYSVAFWTEQLAHSARGSVFGDSDGSWIWGILDSRLAFLLESAMLINRFVLLQQKNMLLILSCMKCTNLFTKRNVHLRPLCHRLYPVSIFCHLACFWENSKAHSVARNHHSFCKQRRQWRLLIYNISRFFLF